MSKKVLIILLLGVIYFTGSTLNDAGTFKSVKDDFNGEVVTIYEQMAGTEDLDIDRESGLLFISSSDRWTIRSGGEASGDGIYTLQLDSGLAPKKLITDFNQPLHPHGISFFKQDGESFLYIINHIESGSSVELFKYTDSQLKHQNSFSDEMMCCPNDLVGVDIETFYVTNDHGNESGIMRTLEDYLKIPSSYLLYYDGKSFAKAYEDLNYANGVALSIDGKHLYLTHTTGRELLSFNRNSETGFLEIESSLNLGTGVDNISVDDKGEIWIGAHPKLFSFVEHSGDPSKKSPSEILRITHHGPTSFGVERVYSNSGNQISGSSVAVRYKDELFVGAVFESKLLRARMNANH
ncbi:MAG: SMP-30/gluconolactonase/LRE family protein [Cyclobacteriaceae bacterium]